jgi:hypothetical protein
VHDRLSLSLQDALALASRFEVGLSTLLDVE